MAVEHPGRAEISKALVVDDEASVRKLVTLWLDVNGIACDQAGTLDEAWQHLCEHEVEVVILDIQLPGGNGVEFVSRIKHAFPDTQVVMLTGMGDTKTAIKALTDGATAYLIKPLQAEELCHEVSKALEHRTLLLERRQYMLRLEEQVREQTDFIRKAHEETINRLVTASMYRDNETGAHIRRVGVCSGLFAEAIGWSYDEVERIRMAAPMHDVGKIGIPDSILQKPGALTANEFEVMKQHTVIGAEMLAGSEFPVLELAHTIALCHHERWDGLGYPNGLAGENIPEAARIVTIVDVYDALTHDRVYRPAFSEVEAIEVLEAGRGTHFDPWHVRVFLSLLPEMRRIGRQMPDELPLTNGQFAKVNGNERGLLPTDVDSPAWEPALL